MRIKVLMFKNNTIPEVERLVGKNAQVRKRKRRHAGDKSELQVIEKTLDTDETLLQGFDKV